MVSAAFVHGDFVKVKRGNVHVVIEVSGHDVWTACNGWYPTDLLTPASGDEPKQCHACWEAM